MVKLPDHIAQAAKAEFETMDIETLSWFEFIGGVEWLFAHLAEVAGEFDENSADEACIDLMDRPSAVDRQFWCDGARWQFEQDRARIGLAESAKACVIVHHGKLETELSKAQEIMAKALASKQNYQAELTKCAALLAENAELKAKLKEKVDIGMLYVAECYQKEIDELKAKLGCAEDEVKCLRSVLSEWDFDKSCYTQMIRANEFNRSRGGPGK